MQTAGFNAEKFGEIFPHMEEILQCGAISYDIKTNTMRWSHGMFSILGVPPYSIECTRENFDKYVNEEDKELLVNARKKFLDSKTAQKVEFSITNAQGLHKRLYSENYFKFDEQGVLIEYNGVLKDITESFYYKKALEQKVQQLDKSNHNLQEFVYVASHDLQEPLRKISTFTERLGTKFEPTLGQEGNMYVKRILSASKSMQVLLEDLLSFSRLSFTDKEFETVSLQQCLDSVMADLEIKIEESKTTITADKLPEVEAYASQMKQLFNNLIGNAIKFRKTDVPPLIKISCSFVENTDYPELPMTKGVRYVKIIIEDNGIGFEQEFSERIFMIFQRLNGKVEYAGSGIGLSICKKITDNHHGFIFAEGALDKGATFTVLLPTIQP